LYLTDVETISNIAHKFKLSRYPLFNLIWSVCSEIFWYFRAGTRYSLPVFSKISWLHALFYTRIKAFNGTIQQHRGCNSVRFNEKRQHRSCAFRSETGGDL